MKITSVRQWTYLYAMKTECLYVNQLSLLVYAQVLFLNEQV